MMPDDVERDGHPRAFATMEAAAAANSMRAEHLEAAYRLAAKRGDTVEAMLARAEARGRQLALELAQAHDELRGMRVAAARREVEVAANAQANTPPRHAAAWTAAPHAVPPAGLPGWMAEHLRQLDGKLEALSQQALRDRSPAARD